jgi:hypothetical protein
VYEPGVKLLYVCPVEGEGLGVREPEGPVMVQVVAWVEETTIDAGLPTVI